MKIKYTFRPLKYWHTIAFKKISYYKQYVIAIPFITIIIWRSNHV